MRRLPTIAGSCAALAAIVALAVFAGRSGGGAGASQPPVLGGSRLAYASFPELAFISYSTAGQTLWECTGTVLAPRLVLTAAHCMAGSTGGSAGGTYEVVTGEVESGRPQSSAVSRAIAFPGYRRDPGSGFLLYDAALLVLATPTSTPAVRLAGPAQAQRLHVGERAEIVGWTGSVRAQGRPAARVAAPTAIQSPLAARARSAARCPTRRASCAPPIRPASAPVCARATAVAPCSSARAPRRSRSGWRRAPSRPPARTRA